MVRRKYDSSTNVRRMHSQLEAHASSTTQHGRVDSLRVPHAPGATIACCCCSSMGPRSSWRTISPCRPHGHAPRPPTPSAPCQIQPHPRCHIFWVSGALAHPRLLGRTPFNFSAAFGVPCHRDLPHTCFTLGRFGGLMLEGVPSTRKLSCGRWPSWQSGLSA